jgi:hypothetical protein
MRNATQLASADFMRNDGLIAIMIPITVTITIDHSDAPSDTAARSAALT